MVAPRLLLNNLFGKELDRLCFHSGVTTKIPKIFWGNKQIGWQFPAGFRLVRPMVSPEPCEFPEWLRLNDKHGLDQICWINQVFLKRPW